MSNLTLIRYSKIHKKKMIFRECIFCILRVDQRETNSALITTLRVPRYIYLLREKRTILFL